MSVKFFHNDAPCKACAPCLPDAGINLLNFGVQHTLSEMRAWTGEKITLLGNVPPRDVLAAGTPADVTRAVTDMLNAADFRSRLIPRAVAACPRECRPRTSRRSSRRLPLSPGSPPGSCQRRAAAARA